MRIAASLAFVAVTAALIMWLLGRAGSINFDLLPIALFSGILIGAAFVFVALRVDLPLSLLQRQLECNHTDSQAELASLADVPGGFGRVAGLMLRNISRAAASGETENAYRNIVDSSPDVIALVTASGAVVLCNRAASSLLGEEICTGRQVIDLVAPEQRDALMEKLRETAENNRHGSIETSLFSRTAGLFPAEVTIAPLVAGNDRTATFSMFFHDISVRRKNEEQKRATEQQLLAIYKIETIGQLARGVAHDLNNSLGAVAGYADLIGRFCEPDSAPDKDKIRKYAGMISSATQRCSVLIRQLLTSARKNRMEVVSFDVNQVIQDTIRFFEPNLNASITVVSDLKATDATIVGDPGQIQDAIINMAINARDAMAGGGTLTIATANKFIDDAFAKSRAYKMTRGYYLVVSVSDTGSGMDDATKARLFEPFFTTKAVGMGTGLGLASVFGSIKNHHGYIDVDSEKNRGSIFSIFLPVNRAVGDAPAVRAAGSAVPAETTRRRTIMVVDDDLQLREMVVELLTWLGYAPVAFPDASSAIAHYTAHINDIDLVILDWKMPGIDGMECFRRIRKLNPGAKVLLSTGYYIEGQRTDFLGEGIAGILPKPFMSADLSRVVAEALGQPDTETAK
jgi:PAS domain S-box-containing protein